MTWTAGVPTIWLGILAQLDAIPASGTSALKGMLCGGSAPPRAMIDAYKTHTTSVVHGWGMTETSPVALVSTCLDRRTTSGSSSSTTSRCRDSAAVRRARARDADGNEIPGTTRRWASSRSAGRGSRPATTTDEQADRWTDDGWFMTGDIVSLHPGASSASRTGRRTSSSPAGSGFPRSRSRTR